MLFVQQRCKRVIDDCHPFRVFNRKFRGDYRATVRTSGKLMDSGRTSYGHPALGGTSAPIGSRGYAQRSVFAPLSGSNGIRLAKG